MSKSPYGQQKYVIKKENIGKLKDLLNVNKNRCSLKINTLRCKLIYTIVKVKIVNAVSARLLEIGLMGIRTGLEIIVWSSKRSIYLVLLTILVVHRVRW